MKEKYLEVLGKYLPENYLIDDIADELLNLHSVSQQRELLAFRKWQKDNWKDVYLYSDEFMISEFKKANCD